MYPIRHKAILFIERKSFLNTGSLPSPKTRLKKQGTALLFGPTPKFYNNEEEKDPGLRLKYLYGYLRPYKQINTF